jgi:sugar lactone lactonase YvrE
MSDSQERLIPSSVWGAAVVVLAVVVALLLVGNRQQEPSEAFRYEIGKFQQVDPSQIIFRESGKLAPGLEHLTALATGADGRIYVAGDDRIVVYDLGGSELERIPLTKTPDCIAVAADGDILLGMRSHIEVVDAKGTTKSVWDDLGERSYITSIAVGEDEAYVADAGQRVVLRFDRSGQLLGRIGEKDEAREIPGFIIPSPYFDVAFDAQGALWAVNPGRHGLENYRANGDLVSSWYRPAIDANGFCGCCNPSHIAFRSDGSLVTTEKGLARVKVYSPDWKLLGFVAAPGAFEEAPAGAFSCELETPLKDLAVDQRGRVLVLDSRQRAVRIFEAMEKAA